jgi:TonB C terminal
MDVVDWQDSPVPIVSKIRAPRRFLSPAFIGIFGTLLLHAMLIQSVSIASRDPKPKSPETQQSANTPSKSTADSDDLILISLPATANASQAASRSTVSSPLDLGTMKIKSPISADPPVFLNLETLALSEDQAFSPVSSGADGAEQARLFGIYTGQIQARIDRIWRRPRTPINESTAGKKPTDADESFQCEAQIVQDARGNVQEIMLPRCNGSTAWQRSLVLAIEQASPLPAPPSASVFSRSITLSFVGLAYGSDSSDDGYEIETLRLVRQ